MEKRNRTHYDGEKDKELIISSFKKCVTNKRELDVYLEELISPFIQSKKYNILDACCGLGYISYFLSRLSPESKFLGIDQTPYLIEEGKKLCKDIPNISFEIGDMYDISSKYAKAFDISINWRTLSWLPYYDHMLKNLINVTKDHVFLSSLFYDGDVDFITQVREFRTETGKNHFTDYCNVYSLPHFKEMVYELGGKNIEVYDFDINIDLPKPSIDKMVSYTEKLETGKRLQISGAVLLFWKIIRIDL